MSVCLSVCLLSVRPFVGHPVATSSFNVLVRRRNSPAEKEGVAGVVLAGDQCCPFTPSVQKVHSPKPFEEKGITEVVRIGGIIIFHLS